MVAGGGLAELDLVSMKTNIVKLGLINFFLMAQEKERSFIAIDLFILVSMKF